MKKPQKKRSGGRASVYDESFKIAIAKEYIDGDLSHGQLAKKYGLSGEHTVRHFLRFYEKWQQELSLPAQSQTLDDRQDPGLEKELALAKLKIAVLEMLINTAENTLGIDIRKKSGTK
jgi:transposase-like protein